MRRLSGKVALITGGSAGIGLATATRFAEEGAAVVIMARDVARLDAAAKLIGHGAIGVAGDVSRVSDLQSVMAQVAAIHGGIDILFANAAVVRYVSLEAATEETFDELFATNVKGVYFTIQKALPLLRRGASVILNSSISSYMGTPGASIYAGSKAAIRSMARGLAAELLSRGIRVNVVSPGPIVTERTKVELPEAQNRRRYGALSIPMARVGRMEEVANVVSFLASDESTFILGAEFIVDGGRSNLPDAAPVFR